MIKNKDIHKVTIDDHGTKKVIIVTKEQYDKIKIGDKIRLFDGKLTINGKTL